MSEIVRYTPPNVDDTLRLGKVLAESGFFADARQAAQAVAKILAGREMGFGEITAMTGIHVINGRVAVGANLMAAAVKKSGKYDYRVREMTPDVCKIEFLQREGSKWESLGISEFTLADARKAGTKNLDKFARNMLFARAMSNGVRWYCPDALGGAPVYTPEEMGADTDEEGNMVQSAAVVVEPPAAETPVEGIPADMKRAINAAGRDIYGGGWGAAARTLIHEITDGRGDTYAVMSAREGGELLGRLQLMKQERQTATA